jgi:hypothetical protein
MFRRIAGMAMLSMAVPGLVCGGVAGVVNTPYREILVDGPYACSIRLDVSEDIELAEFPNFKNGGISVRVEGPSGRIQYINQESIYGGDYWSFEAPDFGKLPAGKYLLPLFLVKIGRDFIFSEAGVYQIRFEFGYPFDGLQLSDSIVVTDCGDCGRDEYRRMFFLCASYTSIFERGLEREVSAEELGEYRLMANVVKANCLGGARTRVLFANEITKAIAEIGTGQVERIVTEGYRIANETGVNVEYWRYLVAKSQSAKDNSQWLDDAGLKTNGAVIIRIY